MKAFKHLLKRREKLTTIGHFGRNSFKNGLAFISLYMSIRSSKWDLQLSSVKNMVHIFTAFDRPRHLADLLPENV